MSNAWKISAALDRLSRAASGAVFARRAPVREAVKDYEARAAMLSDEERAHALAIVDRMTHEPPTRTATEVDAELGAIRASRRRWSRSRPSRRRP
jgi:hypothetical protein